MGPWVVLETAAFFQAVVGLVWPQTLNPKL